MANKKSVQEQIEQIMKTKQPTIQKKEEKKEKDISSLVSPTTGTTPKGKTPKVKTPKAKTPKVKTPKAKTSKAKATKGTTAKGTTAKAKATKGTTAKAKTPKAKAPKGTTAKTKAPKVKAPKIKKRKKPSKFSQDFKKKEFLTNMLTTNVTGVPQSDIDELREAIYQGDKKIIEPLIEFFGGIEGLLEYYDASSDSDIISDEEKRLVIQQALTEIRKRKKLLEEAKAEAKALKKQRQQVIKQEAQKVVNTAKEKAKERFNQSFEKNNNNGLAGALASRMKRRK